MQPQTFRKKLDASLPLVCPTKTSAAIHMNSTKFSFVGARRVFSHISAQKIRFLPVGHIPEWECSNSLKVSFFTGHFTLPPSFGGLKTEAPSLAHNVPMSKKPQDVETHLRSFLDGRCTCCFSPPKIKMVRNGKYV